MELAAKIVDYKGAGKKGGLKVTLALEKKEAQKLLGQLPNFLEKPLRLDLGIDETQWAHERALITDEQRRKIYVLLKEIGIHTTGSEDPDAVKGELKQEFGRGHFSLSNCTKELAGDFIEFLVRFCFQNGVPLREHPRKSFDSLDRFLHVCLEERVCVICGKPADIHHVDAIGMGRNRNKVDDSGNSKMALCREHHTECHQIGGQTFGEKYHVYGV